MSIQPIITAAFSSFPVTRGLSVSGVENRFARSENSADSVSANTEATQSETAKTPKNADAEKSSTSSQTSSTTNRAESTRDAGKPRSASGDILDLSTEAAISTSSEKASAEKASTEKVETKASPEKSSEKNTDAKKSAEKTDSPENTDSANKDSAAQKLSSNGRELTEEQKAQVAKLQARDAEVKAHEAAHLAAAGQYAKGGASYSYQTGPDGVKYAIGGEVSIDSSPVKGDPDATIAKAQQIRTAAMAPANPSGQDYKVAAAASEMAARAVMEKSRTMSEAQQSSSSETAGTEAQSVASNETAESETASTESVSTKSEVVNNSFVTSYNNFSAATATAPTLSANGGAAENPVKPVTLPSNVAPDRGARQSIKSSNDLAQLAENVASANKTSGKSANAESLNGVAMQQATNSVAASYLSQSRLTSRFSAFA